jgi:hypothetical protein
VCITRWTLFYASGVTACSVKTRLVDSGSRNRNMSELKRYCYKFISIKWWSIVGNFLDRNLIKMRGTNSGVDFIFCAPSVSLYIQIKPTRATTNYKYIFYTSFPFQWRNSPNRAQAAPFWRFLHHTQTHTTVGRTPLDE